MLPLEIIIRQSVPMPHQMPKKRGEGEGEDDKETQKKKAKAARTLQKLMKKKEDK